MRANAGMLVTTEARSGADAPAKDIGETVKRLIQARDTHETLAGLAQDHEAQPRDSNQKEVTKAIEAQNEAIRGETAAGHGKFPEFREPHLVLASPAGIETSTAGSTHIASSENLALTTGKHVSIASGRSLFASVLDAVSIFVHRAGMKLIAASGKIRIEAQDDNVEVIARKVVEIISGSDWINLKAVKGIRLNGGGTELEISPAGIRGFTNGEFLVHAASHATDGPQGGGAQTAIAAIAPRICLECLMHAAEVGASTVVRS